MEKKQEGNIAIERAVSGFTLILNIIMVVIGFSLIASENLINKNQIITIFVVYSVINMLLPFITLIDIQTQLKFFYSLMWNPDRSIVSELKRRNPKSKAILVIDKFNRNIFLSFLFWISTFGIVVFLGSLVPRQSAFGGIITRYAFPVRPQTIFSSIKASELFFTLYPAPSETGALVTLISFSQSLLDFALSFIFGRLTIYILSLLIIGVVLSGIYWNFIHRVVSSAREVDMVGHTVFGIQSGVMTIFTGTWIPALCLHVANLYFWYLSSKGYNELVRTGLFTIFISAMIIILIIALIYAVRSSIGKGKTKKMKIKWV